jgi:phosphatidylglycerophosphatase A
MVGLCFLIFRVFDAVKTGPVGWLDKNIHGAFGVMIDDIAAGLLTAIVIIGGLLWMS